MPRKRELCTVFIGESSHGSEQTNAVEANTPQNSNATRYSPANTVDQSSANNEGSYPVGGTESNTAGSSQQERRVREPTLLTDVWNLPEGEKVIVQFNNRRQGIGKEACVLASFLGTIARNPELAPVHMPDWRKFPISEKQKMLAIIKIRFSIPPEGEKWVLRSLGKKWKDYKYELKSEYFEKYSNMEDLLNNKPDRIPRDQWIALTAHWHSEQGNRRSGTNRTTRAAQKMPHIGGTKSIARLMNEMESDGQEPSRAKNILATHKSRKDRRPIDEESAHKIVMPPERYGRVRRLGLGPTSSTLRASSAHSHHSESSSEVNSSSKPIVQQLEDQLKKMQERHDSEMKTMKAQLSMILSSLGLPRPEDSPSTTREIPSPTNSHHSPDGNEG